MTNCVNIPCEDCEHSLVMKGQGAIHKMGSLDWGRAGNIPFSASSESSANMKEDIRKTFQEFVNKRQEDIKI